LFEQEDIEFILGPGTLIEVLRTIQLVADIDLMSYGLASELNFTLKPESIINDSLTVDDLRGRLANLLPQTDALERLYQLLSQPNFFTYAPLHQAIGDEAVFLSAYRSAVSYLAAQRPSESATQTNLADALNLATVAEFRQIADERRRGVGFPYLLTDKPYLQAVFPFATDPDAEKWGLQSQLSRSTQLAVYSHTLLSASATETDVVQRVAQLSHSLSGAEYQLRLSTPYTEEVPATTDYAWESLTTSRELPRSIRSLLESMLPIVSDPIFQQMLDSLSRFEIAIANRVAFLSNYLRPVMKVSDAGSAC
jgi:hypothetical protein